MRGGRAASVSFQEGVLASASWWPQIATGGYGLASFVSKVNTMRMKNFFFF